MAAAIPSGLRFALIAAGIVGMTSASASAVQLANGKTYFEQPPRLEGATATQKTAYFWGSTYYFTLTVPDNAGEPLQKVVITPEPGPDRARFNLKKTEAFERVGKGPRTKLAIKEVTADPKTRAISVIFDPPAAPGRTVTIGLYANRNPDVGGVYLYGVTAFPIGEQTYGQFLGYGRIQIYDNRPSFFYYGPFRHR